MSSYQFRPQRTEKMAIHESIQKIQKPKNIIPAKVIAIKKLKKEGSTKASKSISYICDQYNKEDRSECGRKVKNILLNLLKINDIPLSTLQNDYELKISNSTWYSDKKEFIPRKNNEKRKEKSQKMKEKIINFLKKNSTESANRTIKHLNESVPCRYLTSSIPSLLTKFEMEILPEKCSDSFFRKILKEAKIYKKPKKVNGKEKYIQPKGKYFTL